MEGPNCRPIVPPSGRLKDNNFISPSSETQNAQETDLILVGNLTLEKGPLLPRPNSSTNIFIVLLCARHQATLHGIDDE